MRKDRSPCKEESAELTVDNEAPDTYCSVETEPNISYQTVIPAVKDVKTDNATRRIDKKYDNEDVSCKRFICILVTITLVTLISLACLAVLFAEIAKLKSLTSNQDQIATLSRVEMENNAASIDIKIKLSTLHNQTQQLSCSITMLQQQLTTLYNQTEQLKNVTIHVQNELLRNSFGQFSSNPAVSFAALLPSSPSGYYWVRTSNGSAVSVYCDMTRSCGGVTGGWMRVRFLDMTSNYHQCPSGLREHNDDSLNIRTCVRNETSGGCSSVLSTANIQYSKVCGRITAYQFGSVDGFRNADIESAYVDGVILTHGNSRQHIWTFAAGNRICDNCRDDRRPMLSVGSDFFCDSGNHQSAHARNTFYGDNPLWDGVRCPAGNNCCPTDNPPYFLKTLPQPTTDDIEMRVCRNEVRECIRCECLTNK